MTAIPSDARPELRTAAEVAAWIAAGLALRRVFAVRPPLAEPAPAPSPLFGAPADEDDTLISQAILACASELGALPPPGVIADVAVLLGGARSPDASMPAGLAPAPALAHAADAVRAAVRAYDDDVLARLSTAIRFDDVLAAFAHLPLPNRATAVALVVGAICERAGFAGLSVSSATLRRALARPREERDAAGRAELRGGPVAGLLAEAYLRLARGARQSRALVDDREVFAIDHLAVLGSFGRRLAADHIGAAAGAIAQHLPRRLPPSREQRGARDTQLADDTLYPAGGFTAITPGGATGNIENMVSSELVYMEDDGDGGAGADGVDLFTLRYVEGELLFYTRDDSVFRRHRHQIVFALGPDLDDARVKDPAVPWQRLVLALGQIVAAIRWLTEQLTHDALAIRLAFPPRVLAPERELVELLLEGEITSGAVTVVEESLADATAAASAAGHSLSDLVVVSIGAPPAPAKGQRTLHLSLAGAAPLACELAPRRATPPEPGPDAWIEWCEVTEDLLRWLV